MDEFVKVAKVLVSPCEKLIEAVQAAIGKAYEPKYVKRMADAKSYEINTVGEAIRNNSDITINYSTKDLSLDITDTEEFVKRTQKRIAYQELVKQKNIEQITAMSYELLEDHAEVEDTPIDSDWLFRFINYIQDISNLEMQKIWARILAEEIVQPKSISIRTLSMLTQMTTREANLFQRIAPYIMQCKNGKNQNMPNDYFLLTDNTGLDMLGVTFSDILLLDEIGIISSNLLISVGFYIEPDNSEYIVYQNQNAFEFINHGEKTENFCCNAFVLTYSGIELLSIINASNTVENINMDYIAYCKQVFASENGASDSIEIKVLFE